MGCAASTSIYSASKVNQVALPKDRTSRHEEKGPKTVTSLSSLLSAESFAPLQFPNEVTDVNVQDAMIEAAHMEFQLLGPNSFDKMERSSKIMDTQNIHLSTAMKGISIRGLKKLAAAVEERAKAGLFQGKSYDRLTTSDIVYQWIKLHSVTGFKRLADCPDHIDAQDVGAPLYFISHAWGASFKRLVEITLSHLKDASDDTTLWLDIVAVNQHNDPDDLTVGTPESRAQNTADVNSFEDVIKATPAGTLVAVDFDNADPSGRAWCLFEWDHSLTHHGPSGLHFAGTTPWQLQAMVKAIDVEKATCFKPSDKTMIIDKVIKHHGSTAAFNMSLRLQLLLDPLSYKVDMKQLLHNSKGTEWRLERISDWIHSRYNGPRALCIKAGAGEGKSTISAAICSQLLSLGLFDEVDASSVIAACHFIKYSDQRRLDLVRIVKSISFQLARQIPSFAAKLLELNAAKIDQLSDFSEAFDLLLADPLTGIESNIVLLFDALDEGDPLEQQEAGFQSEYPEPLANQVVYLITSKLIEKLPNNVRFIFTTRPHAVSGSVTDILRRSFGEGGVLYLKPSDLRASNKEGQERVMVFDTIIDQCKLGDFQPLVSSIPALQDVYGAYQAVFDQNEHHSDSTRSLLNVISAAREPLTMQQLASLGLEKDLPFLPGWPCLFYSDEHRLFILHKSLFDWLRDASLSKKYAVNEPKGHAILGLSLLKDITQAADSKNGFLSVDASDYAIKYAVLHLCKALSPELLGIEFLNITLSKWEFLRQVFGKHQGGKLVKALGELQGLSSTPEINKAYAVDALYCIRRYFNDWEESPDEMETVALTAPIHSFKYKEAHSRLKLTWKVSRVLGGLGQDEWPADRMIIKGHSEFVSTVAFSPDSMFLATGSGDKTARIWDLASGQCTVILHAHSEFVSTVAFSPDSMFLATGSGDKAARIWDLASGQCATTLEGHSGPITSVCFSSDNKALATGSADKSARIWDLASRQCTVILQGHSDRVTSVASSPDGKFLATGSYDNTTKFWDLSSGYCIATLQSHSGPITSVAFSPNNKSLATGSDDRTVRIWDLASGQFSASLQGHSNRVTSVAFSPNNKLLASSSDDETARIWDLASGQCALNLHGHTNLISSIAFSSDNKYLATGSGDERANIWDLASGKCIASLQGHSGAITSVAFTSDIKSLATGSGDKTVKIWDLASGQCAATLEGHSGPITSVCFSSDNKVIATGSADKTARIWDLTSRQCTATLQGHSDRVVSVAFSPDDMFLATGSYDNTSRIWDQASGQLRSIR